MSTERKNASATYKCVGLVAFVGLAGLLALVAVGDDLRQLRRDVGRKLGVYTYGCYSYEYEYCSDYYVGRGDCVRSVGNSNFDEYEYGCSSTCFPASSTVMTDTGVKSMSELRVGDHVQVQGGSFETVYAFGAHKTSLPESLMITIQTKNGKNLSLSPSHWMFVEENSGMTPVKAMDVREGNVVYVEGNKKDRVTKIGTAVMKGLFNPMTASGTILVDGVLASVYAGKTHPDHLHLFTAPARAVSSMLSISALRKTNEIFGYIFGFDGETVPSWLLAMDTIWSTMTSPATVSSGGALAGMVSASCVVENK